MTNNYGSAEKWIEHQVLVGRNSGDQIWGKCVDWQKDGITVKQTPGDEVFIPWSNVKEVKPYNPPQLSEAVRP